jgi:hypothetical protein
MDEPVLMLLFLKEHTLPKTLANSVSLRITNTEVDSATITNTETDSAT